MCGLWCFVPHPHPQAELGVGSNTTNNRRWGVADFGGVCGDPKRLQDGTICLGMKGVRLVTYELLAKPVLIV